MGNKKNRQARTTEKNAVPAKIDKTEAEKMKEKADSTVTAVALGEAEQPQKEEDAKKTSFFGKLCSFFKGIFGKKHKDDDNNVIIETAITTPNEEEKPTVDDGKKDVAVEHSDEKKEEQNLPQLEEYKQLVALVQEYAVKQEVPKAIPIDAALRVMLEKLEANAAVIVDMEGKLSAKKAELGKAIETLEADNQLIDELKTKHAKELEAINNNHKKLEEKWKQTNESQTTSINILKSKVSEIEAQDRAKQSRISELEKQLSEKQTKNDELSAEISALKELDSAKLQEALNEANETIGTLNGEKADLQSQLEAKVKELQEMTGIAEGRKEKLDAVTAELKEVKKELSDTKTAKGLTEKKLKATQEKAANLDSKLTATMEDFNDLSGRYDALTRENNANAAEVVRLKDVEKVLNTNITTLTATTSAQAEEIAAKETHIGNMQAQTKTMITATMKRLIAQLDIGGYEKGIGDLADTCSDDEYIMLKKAQELGTKLENVATCGNDDAVSIVERIGKVIVDDLQAGNEGFILPMTRTCAYAYVPFMLDNRGEDNIQLVKARLATIENCIKKILGYFGIELIIPVPFVDKLEDGDYEKCETISNLEYICPNVRAHLERVDRKNKTNIVADIVEVGYKIDGETKSRAKVIL